MLQTGKCTFSQQLFNETLLNPKHQKTIALCLTRSVALEQVTESAIVKK